MGVGVGKEQIGLGQQFGVDARNGSQDWGQVLVSHWDWVGVWVWHWEEWFRVSNHMWFWVMDWNNSGVGNWVHCGVMGWIGINWHWTCQGNLSGLCDYRAQGGGMVNSRMGWVMGNCRGGWVVHSGGMGCGVDHCGRWAMGSRVDEGCWGHHWNFGHGDFVFMGGNCFHNGLKLF